MSFLVRSRVGRRPGRCLSRKKISKMLKVGFRNFIVYLFARWTQNICKPVCKVDTLLESWPWWLFEFLAPSHKSRVLDCYLMEGHKVLFR